MMAGARSSVKYIPFRINQGPDSKDAPTNNCYGFCGCLSLIV